MTLSYRPKGGIKPGTYVVTIQAGGIIDKAGNTLVEEDLRDLPANDQLAEPELRRGHRRLTLGHVLPAAGVHLRAERIAAARYAASLRKRIKYST